MRVVGGTYRGRTLLSPEGQTTRPTSDRAKEGVFNMLSSLLQKEGKLWKEVTFLDGFAGSGAIGIEALSHGAKFVYFVEKERSALKILHQNLEKCLEGNHQVLGQDILTLPLSKTSVDVLFLDAPYQKGLWQKALETLLKAGYISSKTLLIIEMEKGEEASLPKGFYPLSTRSFGRPQFLFAKVR
ncbi:MAG: 16S rRNA (guanine(966)-N(2))-methyltransferase RsmD [Alphaproteobacteria bacterium]|nr:16S rRNA (guanine(966)-N(2))-methyltransferase RsmD [Alphaproteobacteria bacterium]